MLSIRLLARKRVASLKKIFPLTVSILFGVIAGVLLSSAVYAATGFSLFERSREKPLSVHNVNNAELSALAYSVLESIKEGDYAALSRIAHPEYGILFSPQATVAQSSNKRFRAEEISAFGADTKVYVWGVYSGSGEPIEMTPAEYFNRFVFFKNYIAAPFIGVNHIIRSGNALENITDVFPDMQFVEFHIPGDTRDPTEDFDWCTLRLGFDQYNGSLWLTAIIHSEWSV